MYESERDYIPYTKLNKRSKRYADYMESKKDSPAKKFRTPNTRGRMKSKIYVTLPKLNIK